MIYTNRQNLPEQFIPSEENKKPVDKVFSVTELLLSTHEILLQRKFFDKIEIDIADTIPALFGTAVHSIMEKKVPDDYLAEQSMYAMFDINGELYKVKGRCDLISLIHKIIEDYKTCSCSKIQKKDFKDWKEQGLMYSYLAWKFFNVIIRKIKFYALIKDWSKVKAASNSEYPQSPIFVWEYDVQDSDYDYIEEFMIEKLKDIHNTTIMHLCSDEERWYTGTQYAVYKKVSDKRATYVTDDEQDAHNFIRNKCDGAAEIQVRKGEYLKCKLYCSCSKFCEQWKGEKL